MSESPKTADAAPYTPSGAAASERMLSSVLGRVLGPYGAPIGRSLHFADRLVGGIVDGARPGSGRGPAQRLFAQPVPGAVETGSKSDAQPAGEAAPRRERLAPTQALLTAAPGPRRGADLKLPHSLRPTMALSSPERMFGDNRDGDRPAAPGGARRDSGQPVLAAGWEPPVAHAALELGKGPAAATPMWGALARPTLEPLVAAVEADVGRAEAASSESPAMTVVSGGASRRPDRPSSAMTEEQAHQLAVESSKRLMEAVRAHAAANGGSDDRISLGDMTLIAFADSSKQMAAAESYTSSAPQPPPIERGLGDMAHPKIKEDQKDLHNKLKSMAKLVREDLKQVRKLSKERFG